MFTINNINSKQRFNQNKQTTTHCIILLCIVMNPFCGNISSLHSGSRPYKGPFTASKSEKIKEQAGKINVKISLSLSLNVNVP